MPRLLIRLSILSIAFAGAASIAAAQGVPKIDIGPSCRAGAAGDLGVGVSENFDSCRKSEEAAPPSNPFSNGLWKGSDPPVMRLGLADI
jgi:hypothetical protein